MNLKKGICITGSILVFIFMGKCLYIDSNWGYSMEASPISVTGCPLFFESIVTMIFMPLLVYTILGDLFDKVYNIIDSHNKSKKNTKKYFD